jgi:hypothetical protein
MITGRYVRQFVVLLSLLCFSNAALSTMEQLPPYIEFYKDNNCQSLAYTPQLYFQYSKNVLSSNCFPIDPSYSVNVSAAIVSTPNPNTKECVLGIYADSKCN